MPLCPKCATQLPDAARFCATCGTPLVSSDTQESPPLGGAQALPPGTAASLHGAVLQASAAAQTVPVPVPVPIPTASPRRAKSVGIAAVAAFLVAGTVVGSYVALSRTPKQRFFEAELGYVAGLRADVSKDYEVQAQLQKRMAEESTRNQFTISGGINGSDPSIQEVDRLLRRASVIITAQTDPKSRIASTKAALQVRGAELASAEFWRSEDQLVLQIPVLHRNYLVVKNNDLGRFFEKQGLYGYAGPNRIGSLNEAQPILNQNGPELLKLVADYGVYVYDAIKDEDVTLEKKVAYNSPEGTVNLDQVTLNLSESRLTEILQGASNRFRDDEKSLVVLAETIAALAKSAGTSLPGNSASTALKQWQDQSYVKEQLRDGAGNFDRSLSKISFPDGLKIVLTLDGKRVIHQNVAFSIRDAQKASHDGIQLAMETSEWENKDGSVKRGAHVSVRPFDKSVQGEFVADWESTTTHPTKNATKSTSKYVFDLFDGGRSQGSVQLNLDRLVQQEAASGKDRTTYDFTLKLNGREFSSAPQMEGKIVSLTGNKIAKDRYETNLDINLAVHSSSKYDPSFDLNLKVGYTADFNQAPLKLPTMSQANTAHLDELSRQEMNAFQQEIGRAVDRFVQRNSDLFR